MITLFSDIQELLDENYSLAELLNLHGSKQKEYDFAQKSLKKLQNISTGSRICAWIICIITSISFLCFALNQNFEWYKVVLAIVGGFAAAVVIMGVLFLLAKPIFWLVRKNALRKLCEINEMQNELFLFKQALVTNCYNNNRELYTAVCNDADTTNIPKDLSEEWLTRQATILEQSIELQLAQIERARLSEWQWVVSAATIIVCSIIIAISLITIWIVFCILLVLLMLYMAVFGGSEPHYYNDKYYDNSNNYYLEEDEEYSLTKKFLSGLMPKILGYSKAIKASQEQIKLYTEECSSIWEQLTLWNYPPLNL